MSVTDRFALLVQWLKGEPVVVRVLAGIGVTVLAKWGINLSADATLAVGAVAAAVAGWAARQKVTPAPPF